MVWLVIIAGYILGSFPTAYLAGRFLRARDIRNMGDENVGAANAFRELGPAVGVMVFLIDVTKGAMAIVIAQASGMPQAVVLCAGAVAVVGHNWPVFLGFRGGRGVSTTIGVLFVLVTIPMFVMLLPVILVLVWKRNVTPAMAFLFILLPLVDLLFKVPPLLILYGIALPALVGITHFFRVKPKELPQA